MIKYSLSHEFIGKVPSLSTLDQINLDTYTDKNLITIYITLDTVFTLDTLQTDISVCLR